MKLSAYIGPVFCDRKTKSSQLCYRTSPCHIQELEPAAASSSHLFSPFSPETHLQQKKWCIGMSCLNNYKLQIYRVLILVRYETRFRMTIIPLKGTETQTQYAHTLTSCGTIGVCSYMPNWNVLLSNNYRGTSLFPIIHAKLQ